MQLGVSLPCARAKIADADFVRFVAIRTINAVSIYTLVVHLMILLNALTRMVLALLVHPTVSIVYTIPSGTLITNSLVTIFTYAIVVMAHFILSGAVRVKVAFSRTAHAMPFVVTFFAPTMVMKTTLV